MASTSLWVLGDPGGRRGVSAGTRSALAARTGLRLTKQRWRSVLRRRGRARGLAAASTHLQPFFTKPGSDCEWQLSEVIEFYSLYDMFPLELTSSYRRKKSMGAAVSVFSVKPLHLFPEV